ncbi:MAG: PEP-CTERM sorting domain-containing protein [Candidatus Omnitrophota bacterium]
MGNASAVQLLTNGGFESGLAGWINTINVVALNNWWSVTPTEGNLMAVMSPGGILDSAFGQFVNPSAYDSIAVSFDYNLKAADVTRRIDFGNDRLVGFLDTQEILSVPINDLWDNQGNPTELGWSNFSQTYPVSGLSPGSLAFGFVLPNTILVGGDLGQFMVGYIDNVSIEATQAPIPEPATISLLGLGLGIFGLFRLKKRK